MIMRPPSPRERLLLPEDAFALRLCRHRAPGRRPLEFLLNPYRFGGAGSTDPYFANVVALLHFNGTNGSTTITEVKGKSFAVAGNAQLSTTSPKFGTASLLLDGTGDYVSDPNFSSDYQLGSADFTVEAWIKTSTVKEMQIVDYYTTAQNTWQLELTSGGLLNFYASNAGTGSSVATGTTVLRDGNWHHVVVSRTGTTLKLFADGTQEASVTNSYNFSYATTTMAVGAQVAGRNAAYDFNGNIDDVRITKGVGRYTANFTAPTAQFPDS